MSDVGKYVGGAVGAGIGMVIGGPIGAAAGATTGVGIVTAVDHLWGGDTSGEKSATAAGEDDQDSPEDGDQSAGAPQ